MPAAAAGAEAVPPRLQVEGLCLNYPTRSTLGFRKTGPAALRNVSLTVARGAAVGLVGESGSGKSTLVRAIVRLGPRPTGSIRYDGTELTTLAPAAFRAYRRRIQLVFQDPFLSLNPRRTIAEILAEPTLIHGPRLSRSERRERAAAALQQVRLSTDLLDRYPRMLSGGQRQRVGLARALAVGPELLLLDEPLSALDVSLQARLLDLLAELRNRLGLTILFVSHDLAVVEQVCDSAVVLRHGEVVESGPLPDLYLAPRHPYTRELLAAVPRL